MPTNPERKHLTFSVRDFYKDYKKAVKDSRYEVRPWKKYKAYVYDIFAEIFKEILRGWHFVIPYSLGEFMLRKEKMWIGQRILNRTKSKERGEPVFEFNNHSFRYIYKFKWDRTYARFPNAKFYKFSILRGVGKKQKEYGVGAAAIRDRIMTAANDPLVKMPNTIDKPIRKPQNIPDESTTF